jgi:hypothetical protein
MAKIIKCYIWGRSHSSTLSGAYKGTLFQKPSPFQSLRNKILISHIDTDSPIPHPFNRVCTLVKRIVNGPLTQLNTEKSSIILVWMFLHNIWMINKIKTSRQADSSTDMNADGAEEPEVITHPYSMSHCTLRRFYKVSSNKNVKLQVNGMFKRMGLPYGKHSRYWKKREAHRRNRI